MLFDFLNNMFIFSAICGFTGIILLVINFTLFNNYIFKYKINIICYILFVIFDVNFLSVIPVKYASNKPLEAGMIIFFILIILSLILMYYSLNAESNKVYKYFIPFEVIFLIFSILFYNITSEDFTSVAKKINPINTNCVIEQKSNINTTKETKINKNAKSNYINNATILPAENKTNKKTSVNNAVILSVENKVNKKIIVNNSSNLLTDKSCEFKAIN